MSGIADMERCQVNDIAKGAAVLLQHVRQCRKGCGKLVLRLFRRLAVCREADLAGAEQEVVGTARLAKGKTGFGHINLLLAAPADGDCFTSL